jgi:hypothetical protein
MAFAAFGFSLKSGCFCPDVSALFILWLVNLPPSYPEFLNVCVVGASTAGYKRAGGNEIAGSALGVRPALEPPIT